MHTATYSPEDNKCRLYPACRLDGETYSRVKAAGFKWAPKQELFVAPAWTPEREDLLIELCGEVGDEDTSLVERAEQRADRFEDLSDKRLDDAHRAKSAVDAIADQIPLGQPILVGHHSEKRARKDAERIESGMRKAVQMWQTSQYWTDRAKGAIRHAKYKERPDVRARRIKGLEADLRKSIKNRDNAKKNLAAWSHEGLTRDLSLRIANYEGGLHGVGGCILPNGEHYWSAWSAIEHGEITFEEVRRQRLENVPGVIARYERWIAHYENRLAYERAMLAESGGTAADKTGPEKGGACRCWASPRGGWSYIKKVNKVSVTVEDNWGNGGENFTRTIPFDKLSAVMTKAQVDEARTAGLLREIGKGEGFCLMSERPKEPRQQAQPQPEAAPFEAMAETLKAGVQVVSVPQLFPTPPDLARRVVELAEIHEGHRILEPSAGTGNLVRAVRAVAPDARIEAVEINHDLAEHAGKWATSVRCADFLECNGDQLGTFDRIVMNPPFASGSDIKHVEHARKFLKEGGRLVAICANGPRQRDALMPIATAWIDLPAGSFEEAGTNVNAAIVVIDA